MAALSGVRALLAAAAALGVASCAAPAPMVVSTTFADRVPAAVTKSDPGQICRLNVVDLADGRRTPDILGVVSGRAVRSPDNPRAWLQSILGGLATRGIATGFDEATAPGVIAATIRLQTAWVTDTRSNKTANVVLHVRAERAGAAPLERDYRGSLSTINWAGGVGETQRLVDDAFAKALNDMAADFHRLCAG